MVDLSMKEQGYVFTSQEGHSMVLMSFFDQYGLLLPKAEIVCDGMKDTGLTPDLIVKNWIFVGDF